MTDGFSLSGTRFHSHRENTRKRMGRSSEHASTARLKKEC